MTIGVLLVTNDYSHEYRGIRQLDRLEATLLALDLSFGELNAPLCQRSFYWQFNVAGWAESCISLKSIYQPYI